MTLKMSKLRFTMKTLLLGLALLVPFQLLAAEDDSVYSWGSWAQGIQPAAGAVAGLTPAPVEQPQVNFRPNENSAFSRRALQLVPTPPPAPVTVMVPTGGVRPDGVPAPTATPGDRF